MKTIVITGGSGLLALNWARLIAGQWTVFLAINTRWVQPFGVMSRKIELLSPAEFDALLADAKPDLVVHTAGLTNVDACEKEPQSARLANVDAAANVARSCAARQIKLVHISTDHIFTGTQRLLDESAIPAPVNVYALTKVDAEQTVAKICPSALIVRTNFYGWGPSYRRSFSDVIIDALRHGRTITLFEDVFFTPILVDVLIETIHSLVDRDAVGIYNVVGDERLSKYQFGLNIAHRFGLGADVLKAGKIGDARSLVRRPRDMSLCNQKLRAALGTDLGGTKEHLSRLAIEEHSARVQELQRL